MPNAAIINVKFEPSADMPTRVQIKPIQSVDSICGNHGAYIGHIFDFSGIQRLSPCPKCIEEEYKKQSIADLEKTRQLLHESNSHSLFKQSMLPKKYVNASLDDYITRCSESRYVLKVIKNFSTNFLALQQKGTSLIFYGSHGTGKTFLSCGAAKFIQTNYPSKKILYCTYAQMIDSIRDSYNNAGISKTTRIQSFIDPDLLIIDEIGIANETTDEYVLFNRVMDGRYLATGKSVILISNFAIAEISTKLGAAVTDRLKESCAFPLHFSWDNSYRKTISDTRIDEISKLLGI